MSTALARKEEGRLLRIELEDMGTDYVVKFPRFSFYLPYAPRLGTGEV